MAQSHGIDTYFAVEDAAGTTPRNLTTYIETVEFPWDQDEAKTTTKGQRADTYVQGHTRAEFTINGLWDDTATSGPDVVLAGLIGDTGTCAFEYGPAGNGAGKVKYSGECFIKSYRQSSPLADVVKFTATFRVTGPVTRGTFS